ncbi:LysR family transcriptional regulator [Leucobacter sp. HY1910]
MLEMKRLHLLWELSVRGTIARVAEALNFTPSAVSQQLAQLEREAGVPLLRRIGRTLELTPAAQRLVVETEGLLAGLERAEAGLRRSRDEVAGTVRVAVFQTAMLALMPTVLARLGRTHPALRVEMTQYEPAEALWETRARSFDLVVAEHYPGHSAPHLAGLDRVTLMTDTVSLCVAAGPSDEPGAPPLVTSLADVAHMPWVMEQRGAASRHYAEERCRRAGFEPDVRFETADLQAHVRLVETGNAVALLPGLVHVGATGRLRRVTLDPDPQRTIFTAARASGSEDPALAAVRSALHAEAARLERGMAEPGVTRLHRNDEYA